MQANSPIKVLIVDDSWVVRKILHGTVFQNDAIEIIGEAANGIEALEILLRLRPDVILLDMEMPTMDGMTTLQHLMIHTPTPTIMLSSLSDRGTARCFDALKYGAVDFVPKSSFFQGSDKAAHSKLVCSKIVAASKINVQSIDPLMQKESETGSLVKINENEKVIFCEECGTRQIIKNWPLRVNAINCSNCGDKISLLDNKRYRKMNYLTVIGAGKTGYANLLKIIPALNPEISGTLCVIILDKIQCIKSFVKYLNAISDIEVRLGEDGTQMEGGHCYLLSGEEMAYLSPYSGNYTLQVGTGSNEVQDVKAIDTLMISAACHMKNRATGILLSGSATDGSRGVEQILKQKGTCYMLNPDHCFQKTMTTIPMEQYNLERNFDENDLIVSIQKPHLVNKENVVTA